MFRCGSSRPKRQRHETSNRTSVVREAATFAFASLVHSGVLIAGYEHYRARIAEAVIAIVLFAGAVSIWVRSEWVRKVGLAAQTFALIGTLIGLLMVVIGVGPRTVPDIVYHTMLVAVLAWGLIFANRVSR